MVDVIVLQTVSPDYRQPVWRALAERSQGNVLILAGAEYFAPTVITRHEYGVALRTVQNRFLLRRRVCVQRLPFALLLGARVVIAEMNPRILTTWVLLCLRRILRRRTVMWGHAFSRNGTLPGVRRLMQHLADTVVVYTDSQRDALSRVMPGKDIVVAPNALLPRADMVPRSGGEKAHNFIYVGRLVKEKRPDLLVDAYVRVRHRLAPASRLLVVGDGPLRESLERQVDEAGATESVRFVGHLSRAHEISALYATALASVSPGFVGLSIVQSLGFGVPMIVADREPHCPEIEAADPDLNCVFFTAGSACSLADVLVAVDREAAFWLERAQRISESCRRRYSVEAMAERLLDACQPPSGRPATRKASLDALA